MNNEYENREYKENSFYFKVRYGSEENKDNT
jgi:hypothetical protein